MRLGASRHVAIAAFLGCAASLSHAGVLRCPEADGPLPDDPTSLAGMAQLMKGAPRIAVALVRRDHAQALRQALDEGDSTEVCVLGGSLVAFAASLGAVDDLRVLLDRGVDPDGLRDSNGGTALLEAISMGKFDSVDLLLAHGADPFAVADGGDNALLRLSSLVLDPASPMRARQQALASRLLDAGLFVDARLTVRGTTALMQSALRGDAPMVRLLLDHGADPSLLNIKGLGAIDFARKSGHAYVVAMIESAQAARR